MVEDTIGALSDVKGQARTSWWSRQVAGGPTSIPILESTNVDEDETKRGPARISRQFYLSSVPGVYYYYYL